MASAGPIPDDPTALLTEAPGRETEPIVLTGKDIPAWAAPNDVTLERPHHEGAQCAINQEGAGDTPISPDESCSHSQYEDPDISSQRLANQSGTPLKQLLGYRWESETGRFEQIPFQVDEMFTRYISNNASGFAFYSETDQHHSYAFDREGFRWTEDCSTADPGDPHCEGVPEELKPCVARPADATPADPVPGLDTDDELVFLAKDAGSQAPSEAPLPTGIQDSYEVEVIDPFTQKRAYAYVMKATAEGPKPAFGPSNSYVRYQRDAAQNENLFLFSESSFENYGNAPKGFVFDPSTGTCDTTEKVQRRPADGAWITTPRYRFRYDGRWLMTQLRVNNSDEGRTVEPPTDSAYGPDLIDQWKARAFQQRPGGETPCCGFEEEVNNWGGSSILMGELSGPVRAIRETWGADSGTNVVRREIFYRDEIRFGTFLRVHPMPPLDGIYAQWDYNVGQVTTYYNPHNEAGVPIDGINDESFGNDRVKVGRDGVAYNGQGAGNGSGCPRGLGGLDDVCVDNDIDSPDPMFSGASAGLIWEEVAGPNGTLIWRNALKQVTLGSAQTVLTVPYYRDDAQFDDGTGSNPGPHMDGRAVDGDEPSDSTYVDESGQTQPREFWDAEPTEDDPEADPAPDAPDFSDPRYYQGSIGTHGVHFLLVPESDNAGLTAPVTEVDSEWRSVILPGDAGNVGERYGRASEKPLVATALHEDRDSSPAEPADTKLEFVDTPSRAQFSDEASFQVRLTRAEDGTPIEDAPVTFSLTSDEGTRTFEATTDGDGVARASTTLTERPGPADLRARYGGDANHAESSSWMGYEIAKEDTTLAVELGGRGSKRTLTAAIVDADSNVGIADLPIEFSADGTRICESAAPSDGQGRTTCDLPPRYQEGHHTYSAVFNENDYYLFSNAEISS